VDTKFVILQASLRREQNLVLLKSELQKNNGRKREEPEDI